MNETNPQSMAKNKEKMKSDEDQAGKTGKQKKMVKDRAPK
jgi:hypothetical protein